MGEEETHKRVESERRGDETENGRHSFRYRNSGMQRLGEEKGSKKKKEKAGFALHKPWMEWRRKGRAKRDRVGACVRN